MTISEIDSRISFLTKSDNSTDFPAADRLIAVNRAMNRVASLILINDARWQYDDTNQTDLPIYTANLVSGQADYAIAAGFLTIDRIEIKDSNGNWVLLRQRDQQEYKGATAKALSTTTSGTPNTYDLTSNSIFLDPIPNYNSTGGIKVYATRGPSEFTSAEVTTGTKVPGFNSLFHDLIALWPSYEFAVANEMPQAGGYFAAIQRLEDQLVRFYGLRDRDFQGRLTPNMESCE